MMTRIVARRAAALAGALGLLVGARGPAAAQGVPSRVDGTGEVTADGELDPYLRALQSVGKVRAYPWSVHALSPRDAEQRLPLDSIHPWASRYRLASPVQSGATLRALRPVVRTVYNTAFPYGQNDGAVWAGRGLTTSIQAGVTGQWGPLSLRLEPVLFWAENASFRLMPNGREGTAVYANGLDPLFIDLPQRFGDDAYARLDPGRSTLSVGGSKVAVGVSTANRRWGPGQYFPIILGNNAPGFPHLFVETATPIDVWVGKASAQVLWGSLSQSPFSPVPEAGDSTRRLGTGLALSFSPRGVSGLEIGASRFFHTPWPEDGLTGDYLAQPFQGLLKVNLTTDEQSDSNRVVGVSNQIASVHARWVIAPYGLEIYGEFAREDHSYDLRDLILEPDHDSAYLLGFQRTWERSAGRLVTLRGEVLNSQISHLAYARNQTTFYLHAKTPQGHTQRGQVLGSPAVAGGAGSVLALDFYNRGGRWTFAWQREIRQELRDYLDPELGVVRPGWEGSDQKTLDVLHSLKVERLLFRGRFDVVGGLTGVYELNRDFRSDAFNLNALLQVRGTI